jgi:hypothetical protein
LQRNFCLSTGFPDSILRDPLRYRSTVLTDVSPGARQTLIGAGPDGAQDLLDASRIAAIVLRARRSWPVVKVVTAFATTHSITLSLAPLDIVRTPSSIIEPAIAASIVYVAAMSLPKTSFPAICASLAKLARPM